jgi:hypothetical protein
MSEEKIEEILKHMCKLKNEPYTNIPCDKCVLNNTCHYQNIAREMQNSDIVKVVRCKNCKYFKYPMLCTIRKPNVVITRTDYCSYGERKI